MFKAIMQQLNNQSVETKKDAAESAKKTQEMFAEQKALQDEIIEKLRMEVALMSGGGSETSGKSSSGDLHLLVKEKALMETSVGEWKSNLLEGVELPCDWPKYEWPKLWVGRMTMVRALMALKELQKNKTINEAIKELKTSANKLSRNITAADHRLLVPVLNGTPTPFEHDVWELCLLGVPDLPW
jgi:hypothetical protein